MLPAHHAHFTTNAPRRYLYLKTKKKIKKQQEPVHTSIIYIEYLVESPAFKTSRIQRISLHDF